MLGSPQNDNIVMSCDCVDYIQHVEVLTPISKDVVAGILDISVEGPIVDYPAQLRVTPNIDESLPFQTHIALGWQLMERPMNRTANRKQ